MNYVLLVTVIYLLPVAIIFYTAGDIVGNRVKTRDKIIQNAKEQFGKDMTFDEAIEQWTDEEWDNYRKNRIIEYVFLAFIGVILIILSVSIFDNIGKRNPQILGLVILISIAIAIAALVLAYKRNKYSNKFDDNDFKEVTIIKVNEVHTIAYYMDDNGKMRDVCYYDLTKLHDKGEELHVNRELLDYLRDVRKIARKDVVIDDVGIHN